MVLAVGVDDPVAEALHDRAHRLAPVSTAGAADMLSSLGAVSVRTMDGVKETLKFPLPKGLKLDAGAAMASAPKWSARPRR